MKFFKLASIGSLAVNAADTDLSGVHDLVNRQVPQLADQLEFSIATGNEASRHNWYTVSQQDGGGKYTKIVGNSQTAVIAGLYELLSTYAHGSISFTHSTLPEIKELPDLCKLQCGCQFTGEAVVEETYELNTCTFGYTMPFFTFKDWEHFLDYSALNAKATMALAWTGYEQVMIETLREFGFANHHIADFLVSQPFLPWGRFGNIQGNWNATFDFDIPQQQLKLQKQILARMGELGIKPIMPAFVGFLPRETTFNTTNSTQWNSFPYQFTNTTFLDPLDEKFQEIQKRFLANQEQHFGRVSSLYTMDQFNEVTPASSDPEYLKGVMANAVRSLREHDPNAVMVTQAWNFFYDDFWTAENIKNYLSGAEKGEILILDLYSDHMPLYPTTNGYHGHNFIYNSLHDFGSAMGFEGSMQFLTSNFTTDRQKYPNMVGVGITPEGLEGNQMMYDVLFDQAWSADALDTEKYVERFIRARYGPNPVPETLVSVWKQITNLVYFNDQSTGVYSVPRSILEVRPALQGIAEKNGTQPNKLHYDPEEFEPLWREFAIFCVNHPELTHHQNHLHHDLVDLTRQHLANQFLKQYTELVDKFTGDSPDKHTIRKIGNHMITTLEALDQVLQTDDDFSLGKWVSSARDMASTPGKKDQMEFQARNLVTWWGPYRQNDDYSARSWSGLVGTYHQPRWERFIQFLIANLNTESSLEDLDLEFKQQMEQFEMDWQHSTSQTASSSHDDILHLVKLLL